jgi:VWFA-related protein
LGFDNVDMDTLSDFADVSGGRAWLVGADRRNLDRILEIIAEELRSQYSLGFYPSNADGAARWRSIEVGTRIPGLQVRARSEYFSR